MKNLLLLLTLPLFFACSSLSGLARLDSMELDEYTRYTAQLASQVGLVAGAAVTEGDLDAETAKKIASALRGLAAGTTGGVGGALADSIELDSYGVVLLTLAIVELDLTLERRGAYGENGVLNERARGVLAAVADAIEGAAAST